MKLYICTYNRFNYGLATTLRGWPKDLAVHVVVRPEQVDAYTALIELLRLEQVEILPIGKVGITPTRNAVLEHVSSGHLSLIDDDLRFFKRRDDHEWKLRPAASEEIKQMFFELDETLNEFAFAGVSTREGNNRQLNEYADITRGTAISSYDLDVLNEHNLRFRISNREDYDMLLRLFRLGYANRVFFKYAVDPGISNSKGGMRGSPEREFEAMKENAYELAELHPGFVKVVKKQTKTSWGGKERYDVVCYWKKAFASSQKENSGRKKL